MIRSLRKLWRHYHFILGGLVTGYGGYRELWVEIPGTGQTPMDLIRCGYTQWDLVRYFPVTRLNYAILILAIVIALYGAWQKRHHFRRAPIHPH